MRRLIFVFAALLSLPLSANWFEVNPPAPVSGTPVSITFITEVIPTCGPTKADVTRSGNEIQVKMSFDGGGCPADVNARALAVDLGVLPIGEYNLNAEYGDLRWKGTIVVRNPGVPLAAVSMLGGTPVTIGALQVQDLRFGGTEVKNTRVEDGQLVAIAPAHAPGLYDITYTADGRAITLPGAIEYFDPAGPPDATVFERVLFPVLDSGTGAAGSRWVATATIINPSSTYVETFNRIDHVACIVRPCMELRPPHTTFDVDGEGYPNGAVLYAPRNNTLYYGLRVRETSRSDDPGVEIGAVRESRFYREGLTVANVPASDAYRTKLRVYGFDPLPSPIVYVTIAVDGRVVTTISLPLVQSRDLTVPAYAEFDLQPLVKGGGDRAVIDFSAPRFTKLWAFASAVHNSSQKMVIITPQ